MKRYKKVLMLHLRNLRVQLQDRRSHLHRADYQSFDDQLLYTFQFLNKKAYIRNLLTTIEASADADFEKWMHEAEGFLHGIVRFPRTEVGKVKICVGSSSSVLPRTMIGAR